MKTAFECPNCGSENIQKVSVAYEMGVTTQNTSGYAAGGSFSSQGYTPSYHAIQANTTSKTELAERLKPPKVDAESGVNTYLTLGLVFLVMGVIAVAISSSYDYPLPGGLLGRLFVLVGWFVLPVAPVMTLLALALKPKARRSDSIGRRNYEKWSSQWLCHRCGEVFVPNQSDSLTEELTFEESNYNPMPLVIFGFIASIISYFIVFSMLVQ